MTEKPNEQKTKVSRRRKIPSETKRKGVEFFSVVSVFFFFLLFAQILFFFFLSGSDCGRFFFFLIPCWRCYRSAAASTAEAGEAEPQ